MARAPRDRLDELYRHAADLGLTVEWVDLPSNYGELHAGGRVLLHRTLTRAQAATTLAHEIGHHVLGHNCSSPANERQADEYGAALAISVREYRSAEQLVGEHPGALASELEVTPRLIHAWRRWYRRRAA